MKRFAVYHTKDFRLNSILMFMGENQITTAMIDPDAYEVVAIVTAENIDKAFELTNHIDHSWYENAHVWVEKESRSTSVGDVIMDMDTRDIFICLSVGWKKLEYGEWKDDNARKTTVAYSYHRYFEYFSKWDEITFNTWVDMALTVTHEIKQTNGTWEAR